MFKISFLRYQKRFRLGRTIWTQSISFLKQTDSQNKIYITKKVYLLCVFKKEKKDLYEEICNLSSNTQNI